MRYPDDDKQAAAARACTGLGIGAFFAFDAYLWTRAITFALLAGLAGVACGAYLWHEVRGRSKGD